MARILIIDDDEIFLAVIANFLQTEGHDVTVTADGPRGISMAREQFPDLVLLDLGLPSMSGLEVLKELKRVNERIKVIMISGYVSPEDLNEALKIGARAFLDKTDDPDILLQMITKEVEGKSGRTSDVQVPANAASMMHVDDQKPGPALETMRPSGGVFAVGTWSWGERGWGFGVTHTESDIKEAFTACVKAGVTLFDTAESYGRGESERILAGCIRTADRTVRIASKFSPGRWDVRRKDVVNSCRASLKRLGLKQIDLYQIHWPTKFASVEQRMDALAEIVETGLAKNVGVCNYSIDQIQRAQDRLARYSLRLASVQLEFNVLHPRPETNGILQHCRRQGILFLAYSPLAMGLLTGKYTELNPPPQSRSSHLLPGALPRLQEVVRLLSRIGENQESKSASQVAINWVVSKGALPIVGIKNKRQAEENLGAMGWELTNREIQEIDNIDRSWIN